MKRVPTHRCEKVAEVRTEIQLSLGPTTRVCAILDSVRSKAVLAKMGARSRSNRPSVPLFTHKTAETSCCTVQRIFGIARRVTTKRRGCAKRILDRFSAPLVQDRVNRRRRLRERIYSFLPAHLTFLPMPGSVKNSHSFSLGIASPLRPPTVDILLPLVTPTTAPAASTMGPPELPGGGNEGTP